uniref:Uncharacterized protein n=1 Tax=Oryza brachyantha TaxID=4533 RepID=J3LI25_ORYBR
FVRRNVTYPCVNFPFSSVTLQCLKIVKNFRTPDMQHGMEVRLGLSKGPVCPSFN